MIDYENSIKEKLFDDICRALAQYNLSLPDKSEKERMKVKSWCLNAFIPRKEE
jgi:hypothetical protein